MPNADNRHDTADHYEAEDARDAELNAAARTLVTGRPARP